MTKSSFETWRAACLRKNPWIDDITPKERGGEIKARCHLGCTQALNSTRKRWPDYKMRHLAMKSGWTFVGAKAFCPTHSQPSPPDTEKERMPDNKVNASADAKKAKREALLWLDECFDTDRGCYKGGMSDEGLSRELGLSVEAVAKLRDEFGFEIKADPELLALKQELESMQRRVKEAQSQLTSLCANLLTEQNKLLARIEEKLP